MSDAQQRLAPDCLQRALRSRFRQQVNASVGHARRYSDSTLSSEMPTVPFFSVVGEHIFKEMHTVIRLEGEVALAAGEVPLAHSIEGPLTRSPRPAPVSGARA